MSRAKMSGALVFCPDCGRCGGSLMRGACVGGRCGVCPRGGASSRGSEPERGSPCAACPRQDFGPTGSGDVQCQVSGLPSHLRLVVVCGPDDRDKEQVVIACLGVFFCVAPLARSNARTHARTHARTYARTHACTHACTQTHTHTQHTHARGPVAGSACVSFLCLPSVPIHK